MQEAALSRDFRLRCYAATPRQESPVPDNNALSTFCAPKKMVRLFHVATLYAARSTGSCIILCNRVVSQLTLLHHSLRLCRPAGLESSAQLCCGRVALQNENTSCGV